MGKMIKNKVSNHHVSCLVQLHVAEYQAITTRITYISTMQYGLGPVLILFFGLIAQTWQIFDHGKLMWACVLVFELVTMVWYAICLENYNNVRYLEKHLHRSICHLLNQDQLLMYESYLRNQRGSSILWFEHYTAILSCATIGGCSFLRLGQWGLLDWCALSACLAALGLIIFMDSQLVKIRHDFFRTA